jgi:hypothetical protein
VSLTRLGDFTSYLSRWLGCHLLDHRLAAFVTRLNGAIHMMTNRDSVITPTSLDGAIPLHRKTRLETTRRDFWMRWLPTFLSFPIGGVLGIAISGRLDSVPAALVGGALVGAVIGGGQWLVLRRLLPDAAWWIAATACGQSVGLAVGAPLVSYGTEPGDLAIQGAVAGLTTGVLQSLVLRRNGAFGRWWALAGPPLWATGWLVTWAGGIHVDQQFFNFGAYSAITYTILSGFLIVWLLGVPSSRDAVPRPTVEGV